MAVGVPPQAAAFTAGAALADLAVAFDGSMGRLRAAVRQVRVCGVDVEAFARWADDGGLVVGDLVG